MFEKRQIGMTASNFTSLLLLWIISNSANPMGFQQHRIVGGRPTSVAKYPFIVSFQTVSLAHLCGGSIVTVNWVLTAGHCVSEERSNVMRIPKYYVVVAGASDIREPQFGQIRDAKEFIRHPEYSAGNLLNDISLIKLKKPFHLNLTVKAVNMPKVNLFRSSLKERFRHCSALGWGTQLALIGNSQNTENVIAPNLKIVQLPLITNRKCKLLERAEMITSRQMCTLSRKGGKDACLGDSGGPLMCGNVQHGLVSWGEGCAMPNKPGIFTRVDVYLPWINYVIVTGENTNQRRSNSSILMSHPVIILFLVIYTSVV